MQTRVRIIVDDSGRKNVYILTSNGIWQDISGVVERVDISMRPENNHIPEVTLGIFDSIVEIEGVLSAPTEQQVREIDGRVQFVLEEDDER